MNSNAQVKKFETLGCLVSLHVYWFIKTKSIDKKPFYKCSDSYSLELRFSNTTTSKLFQPQSSINIVTI